jgi:tetratricopeptide (TPR) repeat protein
MMKETQPQISGVFLYCSYRGNVSQKLTRWAEMAILRSLGVIGLLIFLGAMIPGLSGMAVGAELAETDMEQGKIFFQQGKFGQAAFKWNEAAKNFEQGGDLQGQSQALLFLAESLQQLGQYHKAALTLELARSLAVQTGDVRQQARVLGRLGNIYFSVASGLPQEGLKDDTLKKAEASLQEALVLARELEDSGLSAGLLNDLGNVLAAQNRNADALGHYIEATILAKATGNTALEATALINASKASLQEGELSETHERLKLALETVQKVPDSHDKAYGLLTIGLTMNHLQSQLSASSDEGLVRQAAETFEQAASVAETIGDARAESYAWGYLGHLYEEKGRFEESLSLTRKAILAAQQGHAPESLYRWHWQMARLLKKKGHMAEAVLAYKRATYTLDPIRQEVMLTQPGGPNSFRESIGPLFFELADLLLKEAKTTKDPTQLQNFLKEARGTVENFKTAELQDYFRDDCVEAARSQVTELDEVSQSTVIIYPIVLEERMELLVSLPSGLKRYEVPVTKTVLTEEVRAFRQKLEKRTDRKSVV